MGEIAGFGVQDGARGKMEQDRTKQSEALGKDLKGRRRARLDEQFRVFQVLSNDDVANWEYSQPKGHS